MAFRSAAAVVASIVLSLGAFTASAQMRVHFIDVGQGEATLLEFPCGAMLIDTGGELNSEFDSNDALTRYLDDFFDARPDLNHALDSLIVSHPHIDHTRGVKEVLARYHPRNGVTDGLETGTGRFGQIALHRAIPDNHRAAIMARDVPDGGVTSGVIDPIDCGAKGDPQIHALWGQVDQQPSGWNADDFKNQNNHSVVIRVDYGQSSILFTGDLETHAIASLIALHQSSNALHANVYKVGHHGSANGTTAGLLQEAQPTMAVMSMGTPDREVMWTAWAYGHPRQSTVDLLVQDVTGSRPTTTVEVAQAVHAFSPMQLSKAVFATGWDGNVVLEATLTGQWSVIRPTSGASPGTPPASALINLNVAGVDELVQLPMIGPSKAQAIVTFRQAHGPFQSIDDLTNVPGIGSATVAAIRHLVTVN